MKKWRWALLLIPVAGGLAMLALPPMDEFAALDRIGERVDAYRPSNLDVHLYELMRASDVAQGVVRRRNWRVTHPKREVDAALSRLADPRLGWGKQGPYKTAAPGSESRIVGESMFCVNDETGATVIVSSQTLPPAQAGVRVTVLESRSSKDVWLGLKRWAKRAFVR